MTIFTLCTNLKRMVDEMTYLLSAILMFHVMVAADEERVSRNLRSSTFNKLFHSVGLDSWVVNDEQEEHQGPQESLSSPAKLLEKKLSSRPPSNTWNLFKLDQNKYSMARCLDGSMGAFWLNNGWGSGSDKCMRLLDIHIARTALQPQQ